MHSIHILITIAIKELKDGLRNRWVAATIVLLGTLALVLIFLGAAPTGEIKVSAVEVSVVSLTSLSMYLVPLIALMLAFDALVGEFEHGTMLLLLTYPVARWHILAGKFIGHAVILFLAITIGYGGALIILLLTLEGEVDGLQAYMAMMSSSFLLGCVFLAIGYLISLLSRERAVAIGAAVTTWLLLVVLYDLGLLSIALIGEGKYISETLFSMLMLANPADAYRLFNFAGFESVGRLVGINGIRVSMESGLIMPILSMVFWIAIPFGLAALLFQRRQI